MEVTISCLSRRYFECLPRTCRSQLKTRPHMDLHGYTMVKYPGVGDIVKAERYDRSGRSWGGT